MPRFCCLLALVAAFLWSGCDLGNGSDEPLPTGEQLRAAYGGQEPGTGTIREGENFRSGGYAVTATFREVGEGEIQRVSFDLDSQSTLAGIGIFIARPSGIGVEDLEVGMDTEASYTYGGEGDSKSGRGRFYVTAVEADRVAGVFAADLISSGLVPADLRITGAVHAVRVEE